MNAGARKGLTTHSPVARLPTGILCKIFLSTRLAQESSENDQWTYPDQWDFEWIKLNRVSRCWRVAALNEPNLWTEPASVEECDLDDDYLERMHVDLDKT
jgi:hypothetical protein